MAVMNRKKLKRWLRGARYVLLGATVLFLLLLCHPQPCFGWSVRVDNLTLYSDRAFSPEAGRAVLQIAQAKLAASPLYNPRDRHAAFVCNSRWRQKIFFLPASGASGLNLYPITTNVFLRGAVIENNRLIPHSGIAMRDLRPLDYFIVHEVAHTLTQRAVGWWRYRKLPQWLREGYSDYLGRGAAFDYEKSWRGFLAGDPEMNWPPNVPYRRYNLLITYLLRQKHMDTLQLLKDPMTQAAAEALLRKEPPPQATNNEQQTTNNKQ
jgi:hypothetical protein